MDVPISGTDTMVAWVLWQARDPGNGVPADLLAAVNQHFEANGRPHVSAQVLEEAMATLEKIGFVEWLPADQARWRLHDWLNVRYD